MSLYIFVTFIFFVDISDIYVFVDSSDIYVFVDIGDIYVCRY